MRALDRPILVCQATIVAGRQHAVMRGQRLVAARLILPRVVVEIAEGSRQAVAAMLQRGPGRAAIVHSVTPPPVPRSSHRRARHGHAPSPRRRGRNDRAGDRNRILPGRHITDCQMRLYMSLCQAPDADGCRGQSRVQCRHRLSHRRFRKSERRVRAGGGIRWPQFGTARWCRPRACGQSSFLTRSADATPRLVRHPSHTGTAHPDLARAQRGRAGRHLSTGALAGSAGVVRFHRNGRSWRQHAGVSLPHRHEEPDSYPAGRDCQTTRPLAGPAGRQIRDFRRATPSFRHALGDTLSS